MNAFSCGDCETRLIASAKFCGACGAQQSDAEIGQTQTANHTPSPSSSPTSRPVHARTPSFLTAPEAMPSAGSPRTTWPVPPPLPSAPRQQSTSPLQRSTTLGTLTIVAGSVAAAIAVAAFVIAEQYKLDAEKVLTNGVYLKDGARGFLIVSGLLVLGLAAAAILVASLSRSRPTVVTFLVLTVSVAFALLALEGLFVAATESKRGDLSSRDAQPQDSAEAREMMGGRRR